MERLPSSTATTSYHKRYVNWEENFVSMEKGNREVHYYLKTNGENLDLAVIGKEKRSRHMSYRYSIRNPNLTPPFKLKSRREVIDWLDSVISDSSAPDAVMVGKHCYEHEVGTLKLKENQNQLQKLRHCATEFSWLGTPWTCRKRRKHYQSFKRNGFQISVFDFVFVLAEENKRLVAYLEDLYEDSRGNKMVVVRWFHRIDEVGIVLPHSFSDREVFFSLYLQDLSIECIDGLTSVLSPQHYEMYRNEACHTRLEPFVCSNQFDNDDVKPYDITHIKGYWKQKILRCMDTHSDSKSNRCSGQSGDGPEIEENTQSTSGLRPKKRQRCTRVDGKDAVDLVPRKLENLKNSKVETKIGTGNNSTKPVGSTLMTTIKVTNQYASQYLAVGSLVEVLSQDSGIRGCWFRASIIKKHKDKVKLQYQDVQDAADEAKKLEEWVSASRIALPDELGLRVHGRPKIRPMRQSNRGEISFVGGVGYIVDAWWHDGWWEGIIVRKQSEAKYCVYFPGEKVVSNFGPGSLRESQDWTGNGWVNVRERPDLAISILSSLKTKQSSCKSNDSKSTISSTGDGMQSRQAYTCLEFERDKHRTPLVIPDLLKDDVLSQLRWRSTRKRSQNGSSHLKRQCSDSHRKLSSKFLESDASDKFVIPASLKVDHDDFKYSGDPSVFSSSVVPSLSNMVMCR